MANEKKTNEEAQRKGTETAGMLDAWSETFSNLATPPVQRRESTKRQINGNIEKAIDDTAEKVHIKLSPMDKLFCKSMARELYRKGILNGTTYSDYMEYLVKKEERKYNQ